MRLLNIVAFFSFCAGIFLLLDINLIKLTHDIKTFINGIRANRKPTMKRQIEQSLKKKKPKGIRKILIESRTVLELTHRTDRLPVFTLESVVLFLVGFIAGMLMNNYFLCPVLAVGLSLLPWLYIIFTATKFKQQLNDELETALGMITTSYLRSDNILMAVRENLDSLQYPVREIFEKFLVQAEMISSDIPRLLEEMKEGIDNAVFNDWVDQLILCQENRTLKSTLQPIVARLSDVREVTGKLNSLLYQPLKDFITIAALTVLNFPFFYSLSREWYDVLMHTTIGQAIVAVTFVILFVSLVVAVQCTKPIEYRR